MIEDPLFNPPPPGATSLKEEGETYPPLAEMTTLSASSSSSSLLASPPSSFSSSASTSTPLSVKPHKTKTESLTIRGEDEVRISEALANAAKKQTTGAIYSLKIDVRKSGTLGIGVKDLCDKLLAVSMLKRANGQPGAGEAAGIRLGDVIFGINFIPTREGSQTLLQIINQEALKSRKTLHLQCWRCNQLCTDPIPGSLFPRADDVLVQAHELYRTKVLSDWERWNFVEILLSHMLEDLKFRIGTTHKDSKDCGKGWIEPAVGDVPRDQTLPLRRTSLSSSLSDPMGALASASLETVAMRKRESARQMRVIDLETNILQAKGLRTALCVRIVHTKQQKDTVVYVLRVEDVETGLQWVVHRRYRDFHALNEELAEMNHFTRDVEFPQKRLSIRNSARLVESRIIALEQYVRRVLHLLTLYASMDPMASRSLRRLQKFLGVDKYIDCIHPPIVDDQRHIELMAYRFLNDFSSPACQQCVRFVTNVDLDALVVSGHPNGHRPVLQHLRQALNEVEQFVLLQHQQQMIQELSDRKPGMNADQLHTFVRRCVRRQVEAALFLPLRRNIFRIVYSFIADQAQTMQRAMTVLQQASAEYFLVPPNALQAKLLPKAIKSFRDVIHAYLPADQGQLLMHAAAAVMELHTECVQMNSPRPPQPHSDAYDGTPILFSPASPFLFSPESSDVKIASLGLISPIEEIKSFTPTDSEQPSALEILLSPEGSSQVAEAGGGHQLRRNSHDNERFLDEGRGSSESNRRMSTPNLGAHAHNYVIKPQTRLSLSATDKGRGSGSGRTTSFDLTGAATMADPVREMFESIETVPLTIVRKAPERDSQNLSFLGGEWENDNPAELSADAHAFADEFEATNHLLHLKNPRSPPDPDPSDFTDLKDDSAAPDHEQKCESSDVGALEEQICRDVNDEAMNTSGIYDTIAQNSVVSADDFLPMFTFVVVQAALPQLLIVKELMTALVDDEESYGECGYYLATLEASTQHIVDLSEQFADLKGSVLREAGGGSSGRN